MRADGFLALVLPASIGRLEQHMADSRYVIGIGGFGTETRTAFPLEGEPTSYVFNRPSGGNRARAPISDVRDGANRSAENVLERLGELGIAEGRVGLSGYGPLTRPPARRTARRCEHRGEASLSAPSIELVDTRRDRSNCSVFIGL